MSAGEKRQILVTFLWDTKISCIQRQMLSIKNVSALWNSHINFAGKCVTLSKRLPPGHRREPEYLSDIFIWCGTSSIISTTIT